MKSWIIVAAVIGSLLGLVLPKIAPQSVEAELKVPGNSAVANQVTSIDGAPLTAVVVTQCNGLLAVYLTMPSGSLLRFDKDSGLPWATLLDMANTAPHGERIEVSCDSEGVEGYEQTKPVSLTYF